MNFIHLANAVADVEKVSNLEAFTENIHEYIVFASSLISVACQLMAMIVIIMGAVKAFRLFFMDFLTSEKSREAIGKSRLEVGHAFSLALALLIGASILKTSIAPTWDDIGKLAAIIAIRTILNYFLLKDLNANLKHVNHEESSEIEEKQV